MPIIKPIGDQGSTTDRKNILFLGDGFSVDDEKLFDDVVEEFNHRFFKTLGGVEPFNLPGVRKKFNVFSCFTPTLSPVPLDQASGISCEYWTDSDGWIVAANEPGAKKLYAKQSFFQLQYTADALIDAKINHKDDIVNFIATLTHPKEAVGTTAIPDCWAPVGTTIQPHFGSSRGMVIVLVNDDLVMANILKDFSGNPTVNYAAAVSIGLRKKFHNVSHDFSIGGVWTHSPYKPPVRRISGSQRHALKFNIINDLIAHELGHTAFGLADEYIKKDELHDSYAGTRIADYQEPNVIARDEAFDPSTGAFTNVRWKGDMLPYVKSIVETNGPLHVESCASISHGTPYPDLITKKSLPTDSRILFLANHPADVIGLYEGAKYQKCGVYRPAGRCKMRRAANLFKQKKGRYFATWKFCYVCKMKIIKKIDSTLIPLLLAKQYPK